MPLPYSFVSVLLCFSRRRITDRKYYPEPLTLGLCPLPPSSQSIYYPEHNLSPHHDSCRMPLEMGADSQTPLSASTPPRSPVPSAGMLSLLLPSSFSSLFCLHLFNNLLGLISATLGCMDVGSAMGTTGATWLKETDNRSPADIMYQ